jgi:hypothetical protein
MHPAKAAQPTSTPNFGPKVTNTTEFVPSAGYLKSAIPFALPSLLPNFYLDSDPSLPEGRAGPVRERSGPNFVLSMFSENCSLTPHQFLLSSLLSSLYFHLPLHLSPNFSFLLSFLT